MDRRLRQFLAVAETGNVSAAAELLHVSQPTISVNMRRLEEEHGVQFFNRSSRGVQLTDFGKVLYNHVKVMARLDDQATAEIRTLRASRQKALRIGTGFAWWSIFVRDILKRDQKNQVGRSLHVDVCSSLDGLRNLLSGDIACFIGTKVARLNNNLGFEFEHLFSVEDAFFVRENHPLCKKESTLSELAEYPKLDVAPLINRHLGIVERDDFNPTPGSSNLNYLGIVTTNSITAGIDILQDSDTVLTYPIACQRIFQKHGIVMLDLADDTAQEIEIGIYRLTAKEQDKQLIKLLDAIRQSASRLIVDEKDIYFAP